MQKDNMEDGQTSREANKVCGVCGDKALGYNFNAVSCESCKAFFRRNAVKKKDFNCPFTENCNITTVTRRFCQKCRLDKCFSIGMRKEYIMSEEDKVLKRNKIEQNRAKKRPSPDNHKTPKTKKESVDDTSFDDTSTSLPSVASGTSGVSETCLWESDRIAELDVNKQLAVDNLSPITAASVPSPSSPPENYDIVGSKTLEMLKDATLSKNGFSIPYDLTEISGDKCSSSQINFNNEFKQDVRFLSEPTRISETIFTNNLTENAAQDPSNVSIIKQNETTYLYNNQTMETCINQAASLMLTQSNIEEEIVKQKSEESIAKESNKKPARNPELFAKLLQNPNILTKVFQNKNFLDKFFSDSNVISKLMSDPQISQILETNISLTGIDELKTLQKNGVEKNICDEKLKDINVSLNCNKNSLGSDQNQVQNPILTNLIINQSKDEQVKKSNNTGNLNEKSRGDVAKDILQDVQQIPIAANSIESILCEAIKLEYSAFSSLSTHSSRELNDAERAKLNELIVAHKALLAPLDEDISNLISDDCKLKANPGETDPMLLGVINLTAIAIRRLIKMAKKISAFKNMCQEDQLALLKGGCTEMMILRSAINYDPDKEIWKIPHSQYKMANIKVEVLKEAKGNLYDEHSKFVRTFDSRWRDENIILILSAIALFSPKRPRVIHTDVIKLEQNSYYYLLRRYLESVYPGCEAKSTFLKLIKKMSELQKLNEEVVGVYLNVNPSSVEPLLIEIFDLKH